MICAHTHSPKKTVKRLEDSCMDLLAQLLLSTAVLWRSKWTVMGFYDMWSLIEISNITNLCMNTCHFEVSTNIKSTVNSKWCFCKARNDILKWHWKEQQCQKPRDFFGFMKKSLTCFYTSSFFALNENWKGHLKSVADPGFPLGGGANPPGGANIWFGQIFPKKLHEIERIWTRGGVRASHPHGSVTVSCGLYFCQCRIQN